MKHVKFGLVLSLCLLIIPAWALALTYTTPTTTDGFIESDPPVLGGTTWETDEYMDTDGGTDFFLTWDGVKTYCGIRGPFADLEEKPDGFEWFIAIDTDQTPGSGATMDGYGKVTFSGNFLPEFVLYFSGGVGWYETSEWDSATSSWVWRGWTDSCSYGGWAVVDTSEICIPFAHFGDPDSMAVVSWITDEAQSQVVASYPSANPVGVVPQPMPHFWVAKDLGENVVPNTLPIQPQVLDDSLLFFNPPGAGTTILPPLDPDSLFQYEQVSDSGSCAQIAVCCTLIVHWISQPDSCTYDTLHIAGVREVNREQVVDSEPENHWNVSDSVYYHFKDTDDTLRYHVEKIGHVEAPPTVFSHTVIVLRYDPLETATVHNEQSFPATCTALADITPGDCGGTTDMTFYYTTDGSDPDETSDFVAGTYDTCGVIAEDTTDTFYAIIPAPDEATVRWVAEGTAKNGLTDWSDEVQEFVQGGTAWIGNQGSSPTTCTVWAEIYVGDDGQTTYMKFPYTKDGSDPRVSATVDTADGTFDGMAGNNDKYFAELTVPAPGDTVLWYAFGEDAYDNYAETDTFYSFVQGDTADIYNLMCDPDTTYVLVTGEVESPDSVGAGMEFYWTLDGSDPKTSETTYKASGSGFYIEHTGMTSKFGAWLAADSSDTVNWYVHAWGSDNAFSDSPNQQCIAEVESRPTICNLACVPDSALIRASISPRGFGSEIGFIVTINGGDPMTDPNAAEFLEDNYLRDEDTPGGDCGVPVGVFRKALPGSIAAGDTIKWVAYAYYREGNEYDGLFGYSPMQICVAETTLAGVEPKDMRPLVPRITNVPNPFSGATEIMFELSRKARVSILVYDIRGRMLDSVLEAELPQGQHSVTWNGRTSTGEALPSGIYFFRFKAGSFETNKKAILIR